MNGADTESVHLVPIDLAVALKKDTPAKSFIVAPFVHGSSLPCLQESESLKLVLST